MRCLKCNSDMKIVSQFVEPRQEESEIAVYSVVDLMCCDPQCVNGRDGVPTERVARKIENCSETENAVSCCGVPICFLSESICRVPNLGELVSSDEDKLVLKCARCGTLHEVITTGKELR